MKRRSLFDEDLSQNLQNIKFAQDYILALMEGDDGLAPEMALKHVIDRMGVKEFVRLAKVPQSNVSEFLKGKRKLKPETLGDYFKPFKLKLKLVLVRAA